MFQAKMRKRGRPEYHYSSDKRRTLLVLFMALWWGDTSTTTTLAIFPPRSNIMHNINNNTNNRHCGNRDRCFVNVSSKQHKLLREVMMIPQILRGGARRGWDEPEQSDFSNGEEPNFLNDENDSERFHDPDDNEDSEADGEMMGTPFLESFQREIHGIVRDYRKEVSDTFQHLIADVRDARGIPPPPRSYSSRSSRFGQEREDIDDDSEDDDRDTTYSRSRPPRRSRRAAYEQFPSEDDDESEDREDMLYRSAPRRSGSTAYQQQSLEESEDNEGNGVSDGKSLLEENTDQDSDDERMEFPLSETTREAREDQWNKVVWDSDDIEEKSVDARPEEDFLPATTRTRRAENEESNKHRSGIKRRRKRRSRKVVEPKYEKDENSSAEGSTTASTMKANGTSLLNAQGWKAMTVAVSFLAVALLLNMAVQILSKMLLGKKLPFSPMK